MAVDPDSRPDDGADVAGPRLSFAAFGLVAAGGVAGTLARYGLSRLAPTRDAHWPWGTFAANVAGAFLLGLILEVLSRSGPDLGTRRRLRLLLGTGLCGGLTTYSTLAVETDLLVRAHCTGLAAAYLGITAVAGLVAVWAGVAVAGRRR